MKGTSKYLPLKFEVLKACKLNKKNYLVLINKIFKVFVYSLGIID